MHHPIQEIAEQRVLGRRSIPQARKARLALVAATHPFLIGFFCLAATVAVLLYLDQFTPIATWLPWKLAHLWFWLGVFVAGCVGLGRVIVRWALAEAGVVSSLESFVLMFAVGVAAFALLMDAAGALHLFHPALAVALPAVGILAGVSVGAPPKSSSALNRVRLWRWRGDLVDLGVVGFGALGVGLVYLHVLDPGALNYDAHWTHVPIATEFVRAGHLV
ncbi:MAG TPA: hypothetical protein VGL59_02410, partial [Polyangia bacterium]